MFCRLTRLPLCSSKRVVRSLSSGAEPLLLSERSASGVVTLTMNNPKRLNAWTKPMLLQIAAAFEAAANDNASKAVVLTGTGKFYCAGADLSSLLAPMHPAALIELIRAENERLFELFLAFPKPLINAVNGPAIGASVTSGTLCDATLAAAGAATFSTPFARLGIVPEGCSSVLFERRMGAVAAERMLGVDGWVPTAEEAAASGLITAAVPPEELLPEAMALAEKWVTEGYVRELVADPTALAELREVNACESVALAEAFLGEDFLRGQRDFLSSRNKAVPAAAMSALLATRPLWIKMAGLE